MAGIRNAQILIRYQMSHTVHPGLIFRIVQQHFDLNLTYYINLPRHSQAQN